MKRNPITSPSFNFKHLSYGFFTRNNGFSEGIFSSLNCSIISSDQVSNVLKNRKKITDTFGREAEDIIIPRQKHTNKCQIIGSKIPKIINADALVTTRKNIILSKLKEADNINIFNTINSIQTFINNNKYDEIWIIGGLQIYDLFIKENLIDEIFITHIDFDYNCDIFFPKLSEDFIEDLNYTYSVYDNSVKLTYKKYIKRSI